MNRVVLSILGLALICLLGCGGEVCAEAAIEAGPFTYLLSAIAGSLLCAVMTYLFAPMALYTITGDDCKKTTTYITTGVLFVASMVMPIVNFHGMKSKAIHLNDNANTLQRTALACFNKVDANHNGTITKEELAESLNTMSVLNKEEAGVVEDIKARLSEVGHVIDKQQSLVYTGKTLVPYTKYTYGITTSDLETYPARIKERYKHW